MSRQVLIISASVALAVSMSGCQSLKTALVAGERGGNAMLDSAGQASAHAAEQAAAPRDPQDWLAEPPMVETLVASVDVGEWVPVADEQTLAASGTPQPHDADTVDVVALGPNRFRTSLRGAPRVYAQQQRDDWCWAACAQMLADFHRGDAAAIPVFRQDEVVRYFQSGSEEQAANLSTIVRAICLDREADFRDLRVSVGFDVATMGADRLVEDLSDGYLPVVGLDDGTGGHAVVVREVVYSWTQDGQESVELIEQAQRTAGVFASVMSFFDGLFTSGPLSPAPNAPADDTAPTALVLDGDAIRENIDRYFNRYALESVVVMDPWDASAPERTLSGAQFRDQCDFILTRRSALDLLEDAHREADAKERGFWAWFDFIPEFFGSLFGSSTKSAAAA